MSRGSIGLIRSPKQLAESARRSWTGAVLVGAASQRAGVFAATLYFLHFVGTNEFAQVVPLMPIAPIVAAVSVLGQDQAVLRHLLRAQRFSLSPGGALKVASGIAVTGFLVGLVSALAAVVLLDLSVEWVGLAVLGGMLLATAQATALAPMQASQRGVRYASCYATFGAVSLTSRVVADQVGCAPQAVWVIGDVAAGAAILVVGTLLHPPSRDGVAYSLRQGFRYGLPLIPRSLAQQMLGNADRWIFAGRVAAAQLAIYVAAYQLANVLNIVLSEVNRSRLNRYVRIDLGEADGVQRTERRLLIVIVAVSSVPLAIISASVSGLAFGQSFAIALGICLSFVSLAFYLPMANVLSMTIGRTSLLAAASVAGAVLNVAVNLLLVGYLGVWSGILANLVGFLAMYWALATAYRRVRP